MADMVLAGEYGSKRFAVKTVREVAQVQKFLSDYKRLLTEQERVAQAEALLFSPSSAPTALDQSTETAPTVEAANVLPSAPTAPLPSPARRRPTVPPTGQRTIDYLRRVLEAAGGRLSIGQVVTGMQAIGWTTTSTLPTYLANNSRSAYNKYKIWVQVEGNVLILTNAGRDFLRDARLHAETDTPQAR